MRYWFLLLILLTIAKASLSDTIYMKSGIIYRNVQVIERDDFVVTFNSTEGEKVTDAIDVLAVKEGPYNPNQESRIDNWDIQAALAMKKQQKQQAHYEYHKPNLAMLPLSLVLGGLTYYFYDDFREIDDVVGQLQNERDSLSRVLGKNHNLLSTYNSRIEDIEKERTEKFVLAAFCAISTLTNTLFSFKTVKVRVQEDRVEVSYNF